MFACQEIIHYNANGKHEKKYVKIIKSVSSLVCIESLTPDTNLNKFKAIQHYYCD